MAIMLSFHEISDINKMPNLEGTIYKYRNLYLKDNKIVEILSSRFISEKEVNSLGKIYFSKNKNRILGKGKIGLIVDEYIIVNY